MILGPQIEVADSFTLAKELSLGMGLANMAPDESLLRAAVNDLNVSLLGARDNRSTIVRAGVAYVLPDSVADMEFMAEEHIRDAMVAEPLVRGMVTGFEWLGSVTLTGFGLRMTDVSFLEPEHEWAESLFVPAEVIDYRLLFAK